MQLPPELQKELVEKAAAKYGNCQELAKHLNIPKSSVHYYRIARLTMPVSVMEQMLEIVGDGDLMKRITELGITKDRTWANEYAVSIYREICRERVRLPMRAELIRDDNLRQNAAALISYILAEGSVWIKGNRYDEGIVNITFASHEGDLYSHFRILCREVFDYDIGDPQEPGNGAKAIRGFIYSTFIAQWLVSNGVPIGDKSAQEVHLPDWVMSTTDVRTIESALQPWCDGEGHVQGFSNRPGFTVSQSRHTDLDFGLVLRDDKKGLQRDVPMGEIRSLSVYGMNLLELCRTAYRSEVLDDVRGLFIKLGLHPKIDVERIHLKDDGFWSCVWRMRFGGFEARTLAQRRIVTQHRKVGQLMARNHSGINI